MGYSFKYKMLFDQCSFNTANLGIKSTIVNYVYYKLNLEVVLPLKPTS